MDKNTKILIADDSAFMRKILKDLLTEAGFSSFVEAENGKDALEKYKAEKPGLVLLDIIMPELDGLGVAKEIGKEANIIIISAVGQDEMLKEAQEHGVKGYIVKPFEKDNVLKEIEKALT